jgi:hypothetical protein
MSAGRLAEEECKPIALAWIDAALIALRDRLEDDVTASALTTNFRIPPARQDSPIVMAIFGIFVLARAIIERSDRYFHEVSEEEAKRLFGDGIPPAYAIFGDGIYFTPRFEPWSVETKRGFGPLCRSAMVVHEAVHVIDPRSGEPAIHVSEWDEPRFSSQTTLQSIHNPSSYASFSAQVHEGSVDWPRDARHGAGSPSR